MAETNEIVRLLEMLLIEQKRTNEFLLTQNSLLADLLVKTETIRQTAALIGGGA